MANIDITKDLNDEERNEVEQLPRSKRLAQIAALRHMSTRDLL
jgi:hypothetical protein